MEKTKKTEATSTDKQEASAFPESTFSHLCKVAVQAKETEVAGDNPNKKGLKYTPWSQAWKEVKLRYPDASFTVKKFGENELPFQFVPGMGYMVYTSVTIAGETLEMFRPVLDKKNHAMKDAPYEIKYRSGASAWVMSANMLDINNAIMRCLVKNLAMFGLGLNVFAGEEEPFLTEDGETDDKANAEEEQNKINALTENVNKMIIGKDKVDELTKACDDAGVPIETLLQKYDKDSLEEMTFLDYRKAMAALSKLTA